MKIQYFVWVLVLSCIAGSAKGQTHMGGLNTGMILGSPYGPHHKEAKGKPGLGAHAGFFYRFDSRSRWGFQLEVNYANKKSRFTSPISGDTNYTSIILGQPYQIPASYTGQVEGSFNNHYLDIPLLLRYRATPRVHLLFGGQLSVLLSGSSKGELDIIIGDNYSVRNDVPYNESSCINPFDYSGVGGMLFSINNAWEAGASLSVGIRSVYKDECIRPEGVLRNIYMKFSIAYKLLKYRKEGDEKVKP